MDLPCKEKDNIPTRYHMLPNETTSTKNGLYLFELLVKKFP